MTLKHDCSGSEQWEGIASADLHDATQQTRDFPCVIRRPSTKYVIVKQLHSSFVRVTKGGLHSLAKKVYDKILKECGEKAHFLSI
jgi:hypothetical protein